MKLKIFLFLLPVYGICYAQHKAVVCGTIKTDKKYLINFYEPINGYYNIAFFDTVKQNSPLVNGTDSFYKSIELTNPSFINMYFRDENEKFITRSDLLLFPGDSINLTINLLIDSPNCFVYRGSNASGHKLFNEINYQPYDKFVPIFDALDRLPGNKATLTDEIDSSVSLLIKRFDTLQHKGAIKKEFIENLEIGFKAIFYRTVVDRFLKPGKKREVLSKIERDAIIDSFHSRLLPTDTRLHSLYLCTFYTNQYYNYLAYKKYNLNSIKPLKEGSKIYKVNNMQFQIEEDFVPFTYIGDKKVQEDLWGLEITGCYSWAPGKYNTAILLQYDSIFPNSKWKSIMMKQFDKKYIQKNIGYKLQMPIILIDSSKSFNTIKALLTQLPKETPVFVDLWASWCGPCIAAFGYNKQLDSFLLKNNIEKLYISFDDGADRDKWEVAIRKYSLGGYHVIANNELKAEIRKTIYHSTGNEGMGIPRYVLINPKGEIVLDDMDSPESFSLLKTQISKTLLER